MSELYSLNLPNGKQYPYRVVPSKRAKYIRIKLSRQGDISVTLPARATLKLAHEFIYKKRTWIERHLKKVTPQLHNLFPKTLELKLLDETWTIHYLATADENVNLSESSNFDLVLAGPQAKLSDFTIVSNTINKWCKKKAKLVFAPMLDSLAEFHGFHYRRLSIRAQKTRWGSCSQDKNISLNCKLLFMPESVVNYVMIHELCHTLEMNHSTRFWSLVEECDADYKVHRSELKQLGQTVLI